MSLRIGSLFAGYGGLDLGIRAALDAETEWFVEFDDAPSRILAHHWPDVPNFGDITAVDWSQMPPVDILAGGFPCQDVSAAGKRRGLHDGTRSGLWSYFADGIDALRPQLVVIENVRGLLSASATSSLEPCPYCVGDLGDEPALRALGAVLGDLADIGYDARWIGIRASDAGAPHSRFRVFIVAAPGSADVDAGHDARRSEHSGESRAHEIETVRSRQSDARAASRHPTDTAAAGPVRTEPADTPGDARRLVDRDRRAAENPDDVARESDRLAGSGEAPSGRARTDAGGRSRDSSATDADSRSRSGRIDEPKRRPDRRAAAGQYRGSPADAESVGRERGRGHHESRVAAASDDRPTDRLRSGAAAHPGSRDAEHRRGPEALGSATAEAARTSAVRADDGDGAVDGSRADSEPRNWGAYADAVRRWELVIGRPAPAPTMLNRTGQQRLAPPFVEWMMGLDAGHVTDPQIGLTRSEQLKALGNGVVPQQATLALRAILGERVTV